MRSQNEIPRGAGTPTPARTARAERRANGGGMGTEGDRRNSLDPSRSRWPAQRSLVSAHRPRLCGCALVEMCRRCAWPTLGLMRGSHDARDQSARHERHGGLQPIAHAVLM